MLATLAEIAGLIMAAHINGTHVDCDPDRCTARRRQLDHTAPGGLVR